MIENMFVFFM